MGLVKVFPPTLVLGGRRKGRSFDTPTRNPGDPVKGLAGFDFLPRLQGTVVRAKFHPWGFLSFVTLEMGKWGRRKVLHLASLFFLLFGLSGPGPMIIGLPKSALPFFAPPPPPKPPFLGLSKKKPAPGFFGETTLVAGPNSVFFHPPQTNHYVLFLRSALTARGTRSREDLLQAPSSEGLEGRAVKSLFFQCSNI